MIVISDKMTIKQALRKAHVSHHHMKQYDGRKECCICNKDANWNKNHIGLFCDKHKEEFQKKYKKMKRRLNSDLTEADYQTWARGL